MTNTQVYVLVAAAMTSVVLAAAIPSRPSLMMERNSDRFVGGVIGSVTVEVPAAPLAGLRR